MVRRFHVVMRVNGTETRMTDENGFSEYQISEQAEVEALIHIRLGASPSNIFIVELDDDGKVIAERGFEEGA